ncbi:protein transport protein Sec61 subunit gamma [Drosophila subpulchrella]|uniref:protein transport protein Sec61 subunit gamma n=1 Tax=Drosophila subpulchrella TaxID=1486046 RepID=UPI0018A18C51|nr:protein transport protein Sec61 subunit gamma [Drosophila subpulchrella]
MEQLLSRRRRLRHKSAKRGLTKYLPDIKCKSLEGVGRKIKDKLGFVLPSSDFYKNSLRFYKRCTKPDRQEFQRISGAIGVGFLLMGLIGFAVKLMHIPIVNIIMD